MNPIIDSQQNLNPQPYKHTSTITYFSLRVVAACYPVPSACYNKQNMNEQEDEFFVQPQVEEVRDIRLIEEANPIIDRPIDESKSIAFKMIEVPKPQETYVYRPFRFERREESDEELEASGEVGARQGLSSTFQECYKSQQCVYQRYRNQDFNRIGEVTYFAGAFIHKNVFLEAPCNQTSDLGQAVKTFFKGADETYRRTQASDLSFDSQFQSGNLFAAFKLGEYQYDLVMSNDTNSRGNNQWFYFSVENMTAGKEYTFSVVNFTKSDSLFNYGMAPVVYSVAENGGNVGEDKGWKRHGKDISYKRGTLPHQNSRRKYYRLTFKISTSFEKDKLFIAHSYPYSTQKLTRYLADKTAKNKDFVTRSTAGKTISKRPIEVLVMGQPINKKRDTRKAIIVLARQHPGQTQGSYVCEGVIDRLLAKTKEGEFLLKNYVVYVLPMVNPDGVAFGHYRTNLAGKDLNRKWNVGEKDPSCPEVSAIKSFIQQISKQRQVRFILDLHGHSKKLNSFFYGNPCPQNPDVVRIFPFVCSKLHPGVQFLDCTFSSQECKKQAARVHLSTVHKLIHIYTFESSFYAYIKEGKTVEFTPKEYRQLGATLVNALFMQLQHEVKFQQSFQFNLKKNTSKEYLNSPFVKLVAELKNNKDLLAQGNRWESGSQSKPEEGEVNNQELQELRPMRPASTPNTNGRQKAIKVSRKGYRDGKEFSFNKPVRNIKFLEINKVNSILPDQYQLGLQPIRKKQSLTQAIKKLPSRVGTSAQTEPRNELRTVQLKRSDIQSSLLSSSIKADPPSQRKYSSVIKSANRNIIFKFDVFGQTVSKQEDFLQPRSMPQKHAYSQTLITYFKEQGERIKAAKGLPTVTVGSPQAQERKWSRNDSRRIDTSLRVGARRQAERFFDKMMKKLINEKQLSRSQQFSNKFILQKPLSIKKKQMTKK